MLITTTRQGGNLRERTAPRLVPPGARVQKPTPAGTEALAGKKADALHDASLVERFNRSGDVAAFEEIVRRHYARVVAVANKILRDFADAEDIAQETFIRAHRGLAKFRGEASLASWLYCIAINLARNRYWYFSRRRRRETFSIEQSLTDDAFFPLAEVLPDDAANPRMEMINGEFVGLVARCMDELDSCHREILVMRNGLHQSYEEIAVALDLNVNTVKSRLARARAKLRALILEAAPEFGPEAEMTEFFEPAFCLPARAAMFG